MNIPLDTTGCPDLQTLVERAGRRHAAAIGEEYVEDPFKRPSYQGGYPADPQHRQDQPQPKKSTRNA